MPAQVSSPEAPEAPPVATRSPGLALLVVAAAQFLIVMDATVVTVGLPGIGASLGLGPADLSWVLTGYALAFGGLLLAGGRTADVLGARRTYRAGLVLLVGTSLLGGLASGGTVLVAARAGQGAAAAFIAPAALSLLTGTFPAGPARARALGVYGAMSGLGPVAGLLLGGALTEYAGWRWILLVNVPVALAILACTATLAEGPRAPGGVDVPGALAATLGFAALAYAVNQATTAGWTAWSVAVPGLASLALLAGFAALIRLRSRTPLLPPEVLADRGRGGAYLTMLLLGAVMLATYYFLTLYMQTVQGYAPPRTGLVYLPMALATVVGSGLLAPKLLERYPVRAVTVAALILITVSMVWFWRLAPDQNPWTVLIPAQVAAGTGIGICFVTLTVAGVRGVAGHHTGVASSVINASTQIGGALGLALLASIAATATANQPPGTPLPSALTSGYTTALLAGGALSLAALFVAALTLEPAHGTETDLASTVHQGVDMSVTRIHHYAVASAGPEELIALRAKLITAVRASYPGLAETRLTRLEDGTYTDVWRCDSAEQMRAAAAAGRTIPEARAAMSLTRDATASNGAVIDER